MTLEEEKRVEYLELIYDLIFVYLIGRSNALLYRTVGGFFTLESFVTYLISTTIILQVWVSSSFYINRYGENGVSEHVFLFTNMYLLYYMGKGIRGNWGGVFVAFHGAWGLILCNLLIQYLRAYRRVARKGKEAGREETERWKKAGKAGAQKGRGKEGTGRAAAPPPLPFFFREATEPFETSAFISPSEELRYLRGRMGLLFMETLCVFLLIPIYRITGMAFSWVPVALWAAGSLLNKKRDDAVPVNFEHLSERAMLYVVFTFGEMVTSIVDYFDGEFSPENVYFSLMAFLIIAGLFLSYGFLYNRVIGRNKRTTGKLYMALHVGLIIFLNNLTIALDFMRSVSLSDVPKNIFLLVSFLGYYAFLLAIGWYSKREEEEGEGFLFRAFLLSALFGGLMAAFYRVGRVSILLSVFYVYGMFAMIYLRWWEFQRRLGKSRK